MAYVGIVAFIVLAGVAWVVLVRGLVALRDHNARVLAQRLDAVTQRPDRGPVAPDAPVVNVELVPYPEPQEYADHFPVSLPRADLPF